MLAERFPVAPADLEAYRALVKLQDEWLVRFGQGEGFTEALLSSAQVVAGTCVGLAGSLDDQEPFDLAIVDEASKATPTEALVPMVRSRRWVLVGDERQLPPFVDGELIDEGLLEGHGLIRADLEETLFAQLGATLPEDRRLLLSEQHRMLRPIGELISHCFYDGGLRSSRAAQSDFKSLTQALPAPVTWYSTARLRGRREKQVGTTYWNESELRVIHKLVNQLQQRAASNDEKLDVAVISGYGEQARRVQRDLRPHDPKWTPSHDRRASRRLLPRPGERRRDLLDHTLKRRERAGIPPQRATHQRRYEPRKGRADHRRRSPFLPAGARRGEPLREGAAAHRGVRGVQARGTSQMTAEETARRLAGARSGYQLVSYREVALPLFKVDLELLVLEKKDLPPIQEYVLRAVGEGLSGTAEIAGLLGIEESIVRTDRRRPALKRQPRPGRRHRW